MAADLKKAKKMALMELIKHVNKKRFQDKEIDPKKEMSAALEAKEERDEPEEELADKEKDFDDEKFREFMRDSGRSKSGRATVAVMAVSKKPLPMKKGKRRG